MDLREMAAEAEKVLETVMRVEPIVMTALSFVPGAKPIVAVVHPAVAMLAPFMEKALENVAAGNDGDALSAMIELLQHVTKGQPNSPTLAPTTPNDGLQVG